MPNKKAKRRKLDRYKKNKELEKLGRTRNQIKRNKKREELI